MVPPKQTDHECGATPDPLQVQVLSRSLAFNRTVAPIDVDVDRLLRTITAPCTPVPDTVRTAQTCHLIPDGDSTVEVQFQWLALEVIGLVLP
ncbi:hypothetical protein M8542_44110 [Amycolatopsis sp. OK19-0408]|uniref:Uncharacterized protein n=1 Tax=Amycolatopsis iheyensis TaxID=2945988 RepID=A0A9X2SPE7_9PSEU|nr:hypothetical protein [Amycolatopsis iheyensis]MCR6489819.1 hypothetical protein [Amycolatopsis iheyensis]